MGGAKGSILIFILEMFIGELKGLLFSNVIYVALYCLSLPE